MYTTFFGLREMPFSITPDPAYLYMSPRHQEALGHLLYGTGQFGGFVQLTGEVGTGKTTVVRTLLEQKLPEVDLAMVLNPRQNECEFVASICDELGVSYPAQATLKTLVDALNVHLLAAHAQGRRTVLIIDEAQNLQPEVLEQVRLLTNLETHKEKLLRIMLVGQPELADLLARPDLRQLAQRITARYHLTPLSPQESAQYVQHRLQVAGGAADLFTAAALRAVHKHSGGVPRLINVICDRALLGAYGEGLKKITPRLVAHAAAEVAGGPVQRSGMRRRRTWGGAFDFALVALILAIAAYTFWPQLLERLPGRLLTAGAPQAAANVAPAPATVAEQAPPAAAPTPEGNLEALLAGTEALPTVLARLVRLWDAKPQLSPGEPLCRGLLRIELECYRAQGSWQDLRLANRPAVLTLSSGRGGSQYVLLRGLERDTAVLETASGPLRMGLDQLELVWTGEFLLLWRREASASFIAPGAQGPAVIWLRERLAKAEGIPLELPLSDRFDPELRDRVARFQQRQGLDVDGLAGARTLIALSNVAPAPGTPTLEVP